MPDETLLGYLSGRFASDKSHSKTENLASEALAFILKNEVALKAFFEFIERAGLSFDPSLRIRTQVHEDDKGVPDLIGKVGADRTALIIEAKFWAGLTPTQPVSYLKKLPRNHKATLLFLAPKKRLPSLWAELKRLCVEAGYRLSLKEKSTSDFLLTQLNKYHSLALTGWTDLLAYILKALETKHLLEEAGNVKQLIGLCERQDSDAFLPLSSEELSPQIGRRVYQYCELIDKVVRQLDEDKILRRDSLLMIKDIGEYGRYRHIGKHFCTVEFNADYWSRYRETPLWLCLRAIKTKKQWKTNQEELRRRLQPLDKENPSRLLEIDDWFFIPLSIPVNVSEGQVIASLVRQIKHVHRLVV